MNFFKNMREKREENKVKKWEKETKKYKALAEKEEKRAKLKSNRDNLKKRYETARSKTREPFFGERTNKVIKTTGKGVKYIREYATKLEKSKARRTPKNKTKNLNYESPSLFGFESAGGTTFSKSRGRRRTQERLFDF